MTRAQASRLITDPPLSPTVDRIGTDFELLMTSSVFRKLDCAARGDWNLDGTTTFAGLADCPLYRTTVRWSVHVFRLRRAASA